jgi:hypothetical protein
VLYVVTQLRTNGQIDRNGDLRAVRRWLPEVVPGEQPHQGRDWRESSKSGAGKSDLHLAPELGGKYEALGLKKGFQEIWPAPESGPEAARHPR